VGWKKIEMKRNVRGWVHLALTFRSQVWIAVRTPPAPHVSVIPPDKVGPGEFSCVLNGEQVLLVTRHLNARCLALFAIVSASRFVLMRKLSAKFEDLEFRRFTWPTLIKFLTLHSFDASDKRLLIN